MKNEKLLKEIETSVMGLMETFSFILKYKRLFSATGIEFSGFKEYVPGEDDAMRIDWKASLRTGKMYVRQYEEELDLDVFIILDACSSMLFGTQNKLKNEYAAVIAGAIASAGLQIGQRVGFAMVNEKNEIVLNPTNDPSRYYTILDALCREHHYGGDCVLFDFLSKITNILFQKTIIFIISDFIGLKGDWERALKVAGSKFERVFGIMVRDIRDEKLPEKEGRIRLMNPFTGETMIVDIDKIRDEFERLAKEQVEKVFSVFRSANADIVKVFTTEPFVAPIIKCLVSTTIF